MIANEPTTKSGINFFCSRCGNLLYRIGANNTTSFSGRHYQQSFWKMLKSCPECGREFTFNFDPERLKISAAQQ